MLQLVDRIWQPTAKDLMSGLNPVRWSAAISAADTQAIATIQTLLFTVAPDRCRVVTGGTLQGQGGAAQTLNALQLHHIAPGASRPLSRAVNYPSPAIAATVLYGYTWTQLDFFMLPGDQLYYIGNFSAGAAANSITGCVVWGIEFPRANIESG